MQKWVDQTHRGRVLLQICLSDKRLYFTTISRARKLLKSLPSIPELRVTFKQTIEKMVSCRIGPMEAKYL